MKEPVIGAALGKKKVFWLTPGLLAFNIVFAWEGAVTRLGSEVDGCIASHRFPTFASREALAVEILEAYFRTSAGRELLINLSPGGAGRNKTLNQRSLLASEISLPPASRWPELVDAFRSLSEAIEESTELIARLKHLRSELLATLLSGAHQIPESYDEAMHPVLAGAMA